MKICKKNKIKKKALTLAEILITTVFLAVVFVGISLAFARCSILNEHNRNLTTALTHAQYVMEEKIKNTTFSQIVSASYISGTSNWEEELDALTPLGSEVIVAQVTGTDLLDIRVTVSWEDRGGSKNIFLDTVVAEP